MTFQKLLCPIDFSDCSRSALAMAIDIAREWGSSITLLHVWHLPVTAAEMPLPSNLYEAARGEAVRELAAWKAQAEGQLGRELGAHLVEGTPWERIVSYLADNPSYDLVVVGTHGRTGIKHVLVGSVAEKVVRHASCPVLVARSRMAPPERPREARPA